MTTNLSPILPQTFTQSLICPGIRLLDRYCPNGLVRSHGAWCGRYRMARSPIWK
jgi:hypothetical protein